LFGSFAGIVAKMPIPFIPGCIVFMLIMGALHTFTPGGGWPRGLGV
jgi:hypothetical protein